MSDLIKSLKALRDAAKTLTIEIHRLDGEISALHLERSQMASAPVSRGDYLDFVRHDIATKSERYLINIRREIKGKKKEFNYLNSLVDQVGGDLRIPYLTGRPGVPIEVTEEAMYAIFAPAIVTAVESAINGMDWPDAGLPAGERVPALAALDARIAVLETTRDELASQLVDAGLAS